MKTKRQRFEVFSKVRLMQFLTALAIITLFLAPVIGQKSQKASDYYNSGLQKQERGDLDGALADYDKAIALEKPGATMKAQSSITQKPSSSIPSSQ